MPTIADIQRVLFPNDPTEWDNQWGQHSQSALEAVIHKPLSIDVHIGMASSFADPADVEAFRKCKERGKSDQECFRVGDNGIGCWGDNVSQGTGSSCAVPPDDMIDRWGSVGNAKHKPIEVKANGKTATVILKDRMPWKKNITNGAIIDLNPDACNELGLVPPIMVAAEWRWV